VPELDTCVFIIPAHVVKNRTERLVILNSVARLIIESARGEHPDRSPKRLRLRFGPAEMF
jgi:hypothetical protein